MLSEIVNSYEDIPGREVTIHYKPVDGCFVMANELLTDVFANLVNNSIKHSDGHVTINIEHLEDTPKRRVGLLP